MLNKCYKCEDILILLFLLEALVWTQLSEVRNKQTTAIRCTFTTSKDIITVDVDSSYLIFVTLERSSNLKRNKVPHGYCFFASSKEQASNGIDKYVLDASVELRPC